MSMRKRNGLMGLLIDIGVIHPKEDIDQVREVTEASKAEILSTRADKNIEKFLKKGLQPFKYDGGVIWSMNQKNADRKAKKRNWSKI